MKIEPCINDLPDGRETLPVVDKKEIEITNKWSFIKKEKIDGWWVMSAWDKRLSEDRSVDNYPYPYNTSLPWSAWARKSPFVNCPPSDEEHGKGDNRIHDAPGISRSDAIKLVMKGI